MTTELLERFSSATISPRLQWTSEPPWWQAGGDELRLETATGTDFWQRTHYGFRVDNGHFLHLTARGNFVLTTQVTCDAKQQYDQAGLMLRVSADCWLKTSVELEPDEPHNRLGAVVTNHGYSDWSTQPLDKSLLRMWFRIRAEETAVIVDASRDGQHWEQIRMAHLAERGAATEVQCGLYACSPKAGGFRATFHGLSFEPR